MTGLNSVVRMMSGPVRLRSALKRKTAPVRTLIAALDGPGELRVRIPASVFGGDIFGVMSKQLREALVFAPPAETSVSKPHRRRTLPSSSENPLFQNPSNLFSPLAHGVKRSTLFSEPIAKASTPTLETLTAQPSISARSSWETQLSSLQRSTLGAGEAPAISENKKIQLTALPTQRYSRSEPALVSSLNRYWHLIREVREIRGSNKTLAPQVLATATPDAHVPVPEQPTIVPRAWPSAVGREVSAKLSSFNDSPLKPARPSSRPDQQIQNVFNISVNHANQPSATYDDLGERIAELLHEQALQHGIDVT